MWLHMMFVLFLFCIFHYYLNPSFLLNAMKYFYAITLTVCSHDINYFCVSINCIIIEKLLRMTMEKLPSPNKYILYRLLCHMYDVHTCSAFNNINLSHVVRIFEQTKFQYYYYYYVISYYYFVIWLWKGAFYRFILRSTSTFHADEDQTTEEAKTIQQVIEMLVHRRDELLKVQHYFVYYYIYIYIFLYKIIFVSKLF